MHRPIDLLDRLSIVRLAALPSYHFSSCTGMLVGLVVWTFTQNSCPGIAIWKLGGFPKKRANGPVGSFSGATDANAERAE